MNAKPAWVLFIAWLLGVAGVVATAVVGRCFLEWPDSYLVPPYQGLAAWVACFVFFTAGPFALLPQAFIGTWKPAAVPGTALLCMGILALDIGAYFLLMDLTEGIRRHWLGFFGMILPYMLPSMGPHLLLFLLFRRWVPATGKGQS